MCVSVCVSVGADQTLSCTQLSVLIDGAASATMQLIQPPSAVVVMVVVSEVATVAVDAKVVNAVVAAAA